MPYIIINKNEIVKAEMERPEFKGDYFLHYGPQRKWEEHCLSLPRIPIEGKHKWKVWQEVELDRDFRLEEKFVRNEPIEEYDALGNLVVGTWFVSAIPIQPTPEGEVGEFSQDEMKKVQDDIDSVNAGAVVDKTKLFGFPCDINELCDVLQNTCQLLNGIKPDAVEEKWWSNWDESVLQSNINLLRQVQPHYRK